jgi:hypothetical protein
MMRFFRACRAPDGPLLGGSPRMDSGSGGKPNSAVNGEKKSGRRFFTKIRLENIH